MSETPWTRLQAPFPRSAVTWDPVDVGESGDEARVSPRLTGAAIRERLDGVLGAAGWSQTLAPIEGGVVCTLRIGDVTKSAVVDLGGVGTASAERSADRALARAAHDLGMRAPFGAGTSVWVPFDGESGVALLDEIDLDALGPDAPTPDAPGLESEAASPAPRAPEAATHAAAAVPEQVPDVLAESAASRGVTSEGQQMIDRLLERLKDEGQGLAAARLLVRHGGYGNDPTSARELYSELRDLLRRAGDREGADA